MARSRTTNTDRSVEQYGYLSDLLDSGGEDVEDDDPFLR